MTPKLRSRILLFGLVISWGINVDDSNGQDPTTGNYSIVPDQWKDQYGAFRSPLQFNDGSIVQSPDEWQRRRAEIRSDWDRILGRWPTLITDPEVEFLSSEKRDNFIQHRVRFRWTPKEYTTGYLLMPNGDGPFAAVVCVFYEPETAIGEDHTDPHGTTHPCKPQRDFALQLARRGIATLSIGTTRATHARTYALYHPSIDDAQVAPLSMLAYAAANAYFVIARQTKIDPSRVGIVGHSFGGKWAMFASCLFDKYACAVWSDPGIVFDETRPSVNYWEPWYLGYHPKPWRKRGLITKENPAHGAYLTIKQENRDLHELHALMAPRPFLVSGGSEDPPQRWQALNHSIAVNRLLGFDDRVWMTNRREHSPNAQSNAVIYAFFESTLNDDRNRQ